MTDDGESREIAKHSPQRRCARRERLEGSRGDPTHALMCVSCAATARSVALTSRPRASTGGDQRGAPCWCPGYSGLWGGVAQATRRKSGRSAGPAPWQQQEDDSPSSIPSLASADGPAAGGAAQRSWNLEARMEPCCDRGRFSTPREPAFLLVLCVRACACVATNTMRPRMTSLGTAWVRSRSVLPGVHATVQARRPGQVMDDSRAPRHQSRQRPRYPRMLPNRQERARVSSIPIIHPGRAAVCVRRVITPFRGHQQDSLPSS